MSSFLLPKERSYFFSTADTDLNTIVSSDRSTISMTLDTPISISSGSLDTSIEINTASLWHTSPNISSALGNNVFSYYINNVQSTIIIEDGLYSLSSFESHLSRLFVNNGQPSDLITFTGKDSTQTVSITFSANTQVDFTVQNSVSSVLGFNPALYPNVLINSTYSLTGANVAKFNTINTFTIKSDLVLGGIPVNNNDLNLLAVIPIPSGSVGRQINYTPVHPSKVDATDLRGKKRSTFYIQICDEHGKPVRQTEQWSVLIVVKELILISDKNMPLMDL
jgi:hypothetical protein